mmetsp:Transcript_48823/g.122847  ORF Transcript_48823/g.122847 Transcript_48823/m.122847 type:complete len:198 (-) Transcript_48823:48-641(-)|eukprot:CAMPEP_0177653892 /NCGR_PEP_ID=MMETSP0447-20121125/13995_1 /TAXON_ID=0 /ORGANISM="Stygamoeba regulata, Strain BSH-02190019" /LENGTH=197 /DNA_ID=CAMNT_0019157413 /DNA_START=399 /DNA_END=992 /DNA_ORIENTATION=+
MIHSVVITNVEGGILLRRFYGEELEKFEKLQFQSRLYNLTHHYWEAAKGNRHQVALDGDLTILFTCVGDVMVFFTGTEDCDELTLSDTLDSFVQFLMGVCVSKKRADVREEFSSGMLTEHYARVWLGLDEMISPMGVVEQTEVHFVEGLVKMDLSKARKDKKKDKDAKAKVLGQKMDTPSEAIPWLKTKRTAEEATS